MKKLLNDIKSWFVIAIIFTITLGFVWSIYAIVNNIWTNPNELEAYSWSVLTSQVWNKLISNQNVLSGSLVDLNTTISTLSWDIATKWIRWSSLVDTIHQVIIPSGSGLFNFYSTWVLLSRWVYIAYLNNMNDITVSPSKRINFRAEDVEWLERVISSRWSLTPNFGAVVNFDNWFTWFFVFKVLNDNDNKVLVRFRLRTNDNSTITSEWLSNFEYMRITD
jgi:hypothetical protein